jgi:hypothetical protein
MTDFVVGGALVVLGVAMLFWRNELSALLLSPLRLKKTDSKVRFARWLTIVLAFAIVAMGVVGIAF